MKKLIIMTTILFITGFTNAAAQVGIGVDSPDNTAILEVTSTEKGFLPPRMTQAERDAIASPSPGLVVYNTTENCINYYNNTEWVSNCNDTADEVAYTISKCDKPVGYLARNIPADSEGLAAKQEIEVTVNSPGRYNFKSNTMNGVVFKGSGNFPSAGTYTIEIDAEGIPSKYTLDENAISYTISGSGNNQSCTFTRKVYVEDDAYYSNAAGEGNNRFIYKVISYNGYEWLQTNLGALYNKVGHPDFNPEMVAQNIDDYKAFGGLYQWGRFADGHSITLWTSPASATFPAGVSYNAPLVYGKFNLRSTHLPQSSAVKYLSNKLSRYRVGNAELAYPGPRRKWTPCPKGFMVAQYTLVGFGNNIPGPAAALASPLKLVAPQVFRNGINGNLQTYIAGARVYGTVEVAGFAMPSFAASLFLLSPNGYSIEEVPNHSYAFLPNSSQHFNGYVLRCMKNDKEYWGGE